MLGSVLTMNSETQQPDPKRRKTRKGTRSCWECKRRKIRCIYARPEDAVCIGCARRCTECVTQEHPERRTSPVAHGRLVGDRIERMEVMVAQLVKQTLDEQMAMRMSQPIREPVIAHNSGIPTPKSTNSATNSSAPSPRRPYGVGKPQNASNIPFEACRTGPTGHKSTPRTTTAESSAYERLAEKLLAAFPPSDDLERIVAASGNLTYYFLQRAAKPYGYFRDAEFGSVAELTVRHTPETHPILIARQMLMLAIVILHTDCKRLATIGGLSETPHETMRRLADTAIDLIATNDMMANTLEGLECVMLQSSYQEDNGNLRQSWLTWRHAISIAQTMGLHRQNPPLIRSVLANQAVDAHFLWYRLLYVDRSLSLMIDLPQAVLATPKISEYPTRFGEPMDELEYTHATVAGKILQRNERSPDSSDLVQTQELDLELQRGAEKLPSRWWLTPNLASAENEAQIFWLTSRLRSQTYHFNLLNQLHLPYMLYLSSQPKSPQYEYSHTTCVNASRDFLTRYNMCRALNTSASSCRAVDTFALWAAMTLLFAHIHSHRAASRNEKVLSHQRLCDRAMVEETLEHIELIDHTNDYQFKIQTVTFLEKMLAIEEDASRGLRLRLIVGTDDMSNTSILRIDIPCVGIVTIAEDGTNNETRYHGIDASDPRPTTQGLAVPATELVDMTPLSPVAAFDTNCSGSTKPLYEDLSTGSNQWTNQGIDLTFFDSLMRDANQLPTNENVDWFLSTGG